MPSNDHVDAPPANDAKYALRRRAALVGIGAVALLTFGQPMLRAFTPASSGGDITAAPADGLVVSDQVDALAPTTIDALFGAAADAQNHWAANGTMAGWVAPAGVGVAHADRSVILAAQLGDGRCAFTGLIDGYMNPVNYDDTGEACRPEVLAEASAGLATNDAVPAQLATATSTAAATLAERSAANLVDGQPSFAGMAGSYDGGITVSVNADSTAATVTVDDGVACATTTVVAGDTTPATVHPC